MLKIILPKSKVIEAFLEMHFTGCNNDMFSSFLDQNFDTRIRLIQQLHATYQSIHVACMFVIQITTAKVQQRAGHLGALETKLLT